MKELAERIEEMSKCHKEVLQRIGKVEDSLVKFVKDGKKDDMKLTLDLFLMYMKSTVEDHRSREEDIIFPFLRSIDHLKNDIDNLLHDHEEIHKNVETLNILKEMDYAEKDDIERSVTSLVTTLREHIGREEDIIQKTKGSVLSSSPYTC